MIKPKKAPARAKSTKVSARRVRGGVAIQSGIRGGLMAGKEIGARR